MPEQITPLSVLYLQLHGAGTAVCVVLFLYLLLCRGKAIASNITPTARLRRWAAALFGIMALAHVWWILFYTYSDNTRSVIYGLPVGGPPAVRVETLKDLSTDNSTEETNHSLRGEWGKDSQIALLLAKHCEDTLLYLQPDLTLTQLSAAIGVNHYYLSQYFTSQDTSYYAYIHDLRVRHFIARYRELAAAHKPIVAQQLAQESGYHSYSTFSTAFKQRMHKSVAAWMREEASKL